MSYKIAILTLSIPFIFHTSLAAEKTQSQIVSDPILLLLGEPKEYHRDEPETFYDCWKSDGVFAPNNCVKELQECSIEESFLTKPALDLKVYPADAKILSSTTYLDVSVPGIYEWNNNVQKFGVESVPTHFSCFIATSKVFWN